MAPLAQASRASTAARVVWLSRRRATSVAHRPIGYRSRPHRQPPDPRRRRRRRPRRWRAHSSLTFRRCTTFQATPISSSNISETFIKARYQMQTRAACRRPLPGIGLSMNLQVCRFHQPSAAHCGVAKHPVASPRLCHHRQQADPTRAYPRRVCRAAPTRRIQVQSLRSGGANLSGLMRSIWV